MLVTEWYQKQCSGARPLLHRVDVVRSACFAHSLAPHIEGTYDKQRDDKKDGQHAPNRALTLRSRKRFCLEYGDMGIARVGHIESISQECKKHTECVGMLFTREKDYFFSLYICTARSNAFCAASLPSIPSMVTTLFCRFL